MDRPGPTATFPKPKRLLAPGGGGSRDMIRGKTAAAWGEGAGEEVLGVCRQATETARLRNEGNLEIALLREGTTLHREGEQSQSL